MKKPGFFLKKPSGLGFFKKMGFLNPGFKSATFGDKPHFEILSNCNLLLCLFFQCAMLLGAALYKTVRFVIVQTRYQELVSQLLSAHANSCYHARLGRAFTLLTGPVGQLNYTRTQRLQFMHNLEQFLVDVRGFLCIRWLLCRLMCKKAISGQTKRGDVGIAYPNLLFLVCNLREFKCMLCFKAEMHAKFDFRLGSTLDPVAVF